MTERLERPPQLVHMDRLAIARGDAVARPAEHRLLDKGEQDMPDHDMAFLDLRRLGRRHAKAMVAERRHFGAVLAGQPDRGDAALTAGTQGGEHVGRPARGRDCEEDIASASDRLDLAREQPFEPVIVADSGQRRGVGGQGKSRKTGSVEREAADKLGSEMLRVGGAPAVAGEQYLVAAAQRRDATSGDDLDEGDELGPGENRAERRNTLLQLGGDELLQASLRSGSGWPPSA